MTNATPIDELAQFRRTFSAAPLGRSAAPGRVNLIGEHTDYNEGFVLPMNVERRTEVLFRPRSDDRVRAFSDHAGELVEFAILDAAPFISPLPERLPGWARYIANVAAVLKEAGWPVGGCDARIASTVPVGGGLSSSASLEVSFAGALLASGGADRGRTLDQILESFGKSRRDLALLCQQAEHRTGTRCGIMDQFVVLHGQRGQAILLDCRTLEAEPVPLDGRLDMVVVIINSRVHHDLAANAYNERRAQCGEAVKFFAHHIKGVTALRDVESWQWEKWAPKMDPLMARRAGHVVMENERANVTVVSLERGDLEMVGACLNASHDSLRADYEVSCPELDLLVEIARGVPGVYGSRMTGGGFGGCTVTLCRCESVEPLRAAILARYQKETGREPDFLVTQAAAPAEIEWLA